MLLYDRHETNLGGCLGGKLELLVAFGVMCASILCFNNDSCAAKDRPQPGTPHLKELFGA